MTKYKKDYKKTSISWLKAIAKTVAVILLCAVIFVTGLMFYCNNFLTYYPIDGGSMRPLLNQNQETGDCAYVTRSADGITYGNVVIYNRNGQTLVIKRIIAMENDNIKIKQKDDGEYAIFIQYNSTGDWQELNEEYIYDKTVYESLYKKFYNIDNDDKAEHISASDFLTDESGDKYYHIGEGKIFYAGDNRLGSTDCFNYGAMTKDNLVGKVVYVIHSGEIRVWQVLKQFLGIYKWK